MKLKHLITIIIIITTACMIWLTTWPSAKQYPLSNHYDGTRFFNLNHQANHKSLWEALVWRITTHSTPWPIFDEENNAIPDLSPLLSQQLMRVIFVNHSTVLLQWQDLNIITDPVLVPSIGPQFMAWMKRHSPPGLTFEQLPKIDYILISHNHYDHLDRPTLSAILARDQSQVITPLAVTQYLPTMTTENQHELDWWQAYHDKTKNLHITLVPAQHWSKRNLFQSNESLWGGFVIQRGHKVIYFAGDTAYANHFKLIKQKFPNIDVALIPIGAYKPRSFMKIAHIDPEEAVLAAKELQAKLNIGIHFGTFHLSDEGIDSPRIDLELAKHKYKLNAPFIAPKNGQTFN